MGTPAPPPPAYGAPPPGYAAPVPMGPGPIGKVRGTGVSILLFIVTLGIYGYVWWWLVHDEMKRHSGQGLGGPIAFIIAFVIAPVQAFLTADEVGKPYERAGPAKPVSATTGLWYFPGIFILIGPIVWFVKVNGAINEYWKSLGAPA
jgi:hypothetical protein